ncbi:putative glycosyl transferase [Hyphomonas neptunium ATCC 15444]|uniref:Putative glycosyl transferase n=2 Tax=Hyphomonas TaxID=85 RepID=Q0C423_HYPNA|nr:putative glycosyl transferase [Hyphomonas neptunium ATCC 15444]KCZ96268.1 putative glycosyl transferase [Hyphomonas hirschiana VP5]
MDLNAPGLGDRLLWRMRNLVLQRPGNGADWAPGELVYVAGLFSTASGIGQSARACADALEVSGVNVIRIDLSAGFGQVDLHAPMGALLSHRLSQCPRGGTLIVHLNAPELERALFLCRNWRGAGRRLIAAWVWELPIAPASWDKAVDLFDELWVPSTFTQASMKSLCGKPIRVVPYYLGDLSGFRAATGSHRGVRCVAFADGRSSFERKNVLGAVRAFRQAHLPEGSMLTVKTRNLYLSEEFRLHISQAVESDERINIIDESMPRSTLLQLVADHDILLSLHRAEGFGLPIAEAMAMGKVVIATGWSGNMDFMDETCSVPVPYELVEVADKYNVYTGHTGAVWADPDVGAAAAALTQIADDPALRLRLGETARSKMKSLSSGEHYLAALRPNKS